MWCEEVLEDIVANPIDCGPRLGSLKRDYVVTVDRVGLCHVSLAAALNTAAVSRRVHTVEALGVNVRQVNGLVGDSATKWTLCCLIECHLFVQQAHYHIFHEFKILNLALVQVRLIRSETGRINEVLSA